MTELNNFLAQKLFTLWKIGMRRSPARYLRRRHIDEARRSNEPFVARLGSGIKIWVEPDLYIGKIYLQGYYEPHVVRLIKKMLKPGMSCVDVGANVGYFSLLMSKLVGPNGQVIAFEPTPETAEILNRNKVLNGYKQLLVEQIALSNQNGTVTFNVGTPGFEVYNSCGNIVHPRADRTAFRHITVPTVRLDDYLQNPASPANERRLDLIKIDVEGGELDALQGMEQTLEANEEATLLIEFSDITSQSFGHSAGHMQWWLEERGWVLRIIGPFATLVSPIAGQRWHGQMVAARRRWVP